MNSTSGCHGGSGSNGIAGGTTVNVHFSLDSNIPNETTADQVSECFYNLFNSFDPSESLDKAQIALHFLNVTNSNSQSVTSSEKVTGTAIWPSTNQAPTEQEPGPLPFLVSAAAYGWIRKIRWLIRRSEAKFHPDSVVSWDDP
jgi:hypothetical protein